MGGKKDGRGERNKWMERRLTEDKERSGRIEGWVRREGYVKVTGYLDPVSL